MPFPLFKRLYSTPIKIPFALQAAALFDLKRGLLRVHGPDAAKFLNGLCTSNIIKLADSSEAHGHPTAFLTHQVQNLLSMRQHIGPRALGRIRIQSVLGRVPGRLRPPHLGRPDASSQDVPAAQPRHHRPSRRRLQRLAVLEDGCGRQMHRQGHPLRLGALSKHCACSPSCCADAGTKMVRHAAHDPRHCRGPNRGAPQPSHTA